MIGDIFASPGNSKIDLLREVQTKYKSCTVTDPLQILLNLSLLVRQRLGRLSIRMEAVRAEVIPPPTNNTRDPLMTNSENINLRAN